MRVRPAAVVSGVLLLAAGGLFAASAVASGGTDLRAERATELRDLIRIQAQRTARGEQDVAALQAEVEAIAAQDAANPEVAAARSRIEALATPAGFTEESGPGLRVTLDDAPKMAPDDPLAGEVNPDDLVVHQQDVQSVINALWRGGASGLQVMDQRIIATSAIRCVGNTLILQGRVYSPPFTISAVGDPAALRAALDADRGVELYRSWAEVVGLVYDVRTEPSLTIPAYDGAVSMTYATAE